MARLSAEDRRLFDRANKRIEAFNKLGLKNDIIEIIQNELMNVYLDASADMVDTKHVNYNKFSMNTEVMQGERLEDARNIANALLDAKSSTLRYYRQHEDEGEYRAMSYETVKSNPAYGVSNFQEYIEFIDNMKELRKDEEYKKTLKKLGISENEMTYENLKGKPEFGIDSFQDYINFIDDMKHAREMKTLLNNLGSKNVARLYAYGKEKRFSKKEIEKLMLTTRKKFLEQDDLYNFLRNKIDAMYKKRNK